MLKLARKEGERVFITTPSGEEIIIENLGNNRVGIDAPKEYVIAREELLDTEYEYST